MNRKIISVCLTLVLVFLINPISGNAKTSIEPDKSKESMILDELAEGNNIVTKDKCAIEPLIHGTCPKCGNWGYTVCAAEAKTDTVFYHNTLFTKDCKVTGLVSRGATMCGSCSYLIEQYGYHPCWEVHNKCSKGSIDLCPMDIS